MYDASVNFIVLMRFPDPVQVPLVHIAEAVMTILFVSLDSGNILAKYKAIPTVLQGAGNSASNFPRLSGRLMIFRSALEYAGCQSCSEYCTLVRQK